MLNINYQTRIITNEGITYKGNNFIGYFGELQEVEKNPITYIKGLYGFNIIVD